MTTRKKNWFILSGVVVLCAVAAALTLRHYSGQLLKTHIVRSLGENVKAGSVAISWGKVVVGDLTFLREGRVVGTIKSVAVRADFTSILKDRLSISKVEVEEPHFRLLIDKQGNFILPVAVPLRKTGKEKGGKEQRESRAQEPMPVEIKSLVVKGGTVAFEDRSVSRPVFLNFTDVTVEVRDIAYPFTNRWTTYDITSRLAGGSQTGSITATGRTNLGNEQTNAKTTLKGIDLALLKSYVELKGGDAGIKSGFIDMTMQADIAKKHLRAPGTMVIRDLQLSSSGAASETFFGVPRSLMLAFLKNNRDDISLDFVLEGNLNNPKFTIREDLAKRIAVALATRFGVSIKGAEDVLAGQGKGIIDEAAKTFKRIFKQ